MTDTITQPHPRGYVTGHIYQLDGSQNATVILKRVGGEYADVCFAVDWRQEMFPVALSRLHPFNPAGVLQ